MTSPKLHRRAPRDPEGRMPLIEHVRELRGRLFKAFLGLLAGTIVGFIFFDQIWAVLKQPYCQLSIAHRLPGPQCDLVVHTIFEAFFLQLRVAVIIGVVISSPVWLSQIWGFVTPGLRKNEKRWALAFVGTATPLFLGGAALAYLMLNKGLRILLSFTPTGVIPLIGVTHYLKYATLMVLVFGVSFELPLLVVMLNLVGILSHEQLAKHRRAILFGVFVFAAVATPSQDPVTMLALSVPMVVLFELAELVAFLNDRRRARREAEAPYAQLSDDETSEFGLEDTYDLEDEDR
ncbi:MAG: twin-arginine translocase subunit TatC [Streptosporangiaceae bacterium]